MTASSFHSDPDCRSSLNRRAVLAGAASICASTSIAATPRGLHDVAADTARALAAGRTVNLRLLIPEGTGRSVDMAAYAFYKATGISIEKTTSHVDDINTEIALNHLSQTKNYDLALPSTPGVSDLAQNGAIQPITSFAKRHEPNGFREGLLYRSGDIIDDDIYGFQADGDAYLMFYNQEMLHNDEDQDRYASRFGIELTKPDTWDELDRQMAFFHRPEHNRYGGLLFRIAGYVAWEWWVRFHAKGSWPFTREMEPLIASDHGISALEDMIAVTDYLHPAVSNLDLFSNWQVYSEGETYANIGWGGSQKFFRRAGSKMRDNMEYGPTPGGIVNGSYLSTPYFNWGWSYVVTSDSREPELAYLFALFASSPTISTMSVQQSNGFFDPFRPEHYDDASIQNTYSKDFLNVHRFSLENSIPDLYLHLQTEYFQSLGSWIYRAINRDVSAKIALESVAQKWETITRQAGKAHQIKDWEVLRQAYPLALRAQLQGLS